MEREKAKGILERGRNYVVGSERGAEETVTDITCS